MHFKVLVLFVLHLFYLQLVFCFFEKFSNAGNEAQKYCAKSGQITDDGMQPAEEADDLSVQLCESHCFALWLEDPINGSISILGQGKLKKYIKDVTEFDCCVMLFTGTMFFFSCVLKGHLVFICNLSGRNMNGNVIYVYFALSVPLATLYT